MHPSDNNIGNLNRTSRPIQQQEIRDKIKKFSNNMEEVFVNLMLQEMNKTVQREDPQSTSDQYYQDMLTTERGKLMVEHNGGIGLSNLIYQQLTKDMGPVNLAGSKSNLENSNTIDKYKGQPKVRSYQLRGPHERN